MSSPSVSLVLRGRAFLWLGIVLRLALFVVQDDKQADAPMRALIAERLVLEPAARASTAAFCQFGPLPIELMRPFVASWPGHPEITARLLALVAGLLTLPLFLRYARAWVDETSADLALLAFAVSPLALQLHTTASSESLYLLLVLGAACALLAHEERRRGATWLAAGLLFSLAAVTRFDAWLGLPAAAAAWVLADREAPLGERLGKAAGLLALAFLLPVGYLAWSAHTTGDPFFFVRFIRGDHARLGASAIARYGPLVARVRQLALWLVSAVAAATPVLALGLARLRRGMLARQGEDRVSPARAAVVAFGLAPIAIYVVQGLVTGAFEPLPRFALLPCVLLLPKAAARLVELGGVWARRSLVAATGLGFSVVIVVVARAGGGRAWGGAESLGAWTRLDHEDRALVDFLRTHRGPGEKVFIDPLAFIDIAIAHAAGIPQRDVATLTETRTPQRTLAATAASTSARWLAAHDTGWGRTGIPDWPVLGTSIGGWHVAHVDDQGRPLPIAP